MGAGVRINRSMIEGCNLFKALSKRGQCRPTICEYVIPRGWIFKDNGYDTILKRSRLASSEEGCFEVQDESHVDVKFL